MFFKPSEVVHAFAQEPYTKKADALEKRAKRFNQLVYHLKNADPVIYDKKEMSAGQAFAQAANPVIEPWFDTALVLPMPGSGVSPKDRSSEKTVVYAKALVARFGSTARLSVALVRRASVSRSHRVAATERPTVTQHRDSMGLLTPHDVRGAKAVVLVDDVLTRGSTTIGAALVVRDTGYTGPIYLVAGAYTRFREDPFHEDVEFAIEWSVGSDHPLKRRTKVHQEGPPPDDEIPE